MFCPLCESARLETVWIKPNGPQKNRAYILCETCLLIFVASPFHLSLNEQKPFYDHHQNDPGSAGYVAHLQRLATPLQEFLKPNSRGLDYGCGPGPTLAGLLHKNGFAMANYDPIYAPNADLLQTQYDFVTSTEVVEHFSKPRTDWQILTGLVKPGGILGIMTQFRPDVSAFADWWYHRDATHICFYHKSTFERLAADFSFEILFCQNPVVIFRKI